MAYKEKKDPLTGKGKRHQIAGIDSIRKIEKELKIMVKGTIVLRVYFSREQAKEIGDALGIDWKEFSLDEFHMGVNVELEHGKRDGETNVSYDDPLTTGKIAWAHLKEKRNYYTLLKKVEG